MKYNEHKIEYSREWRGPLKNRSCTDWPCLFIFVVFMAVWIAIGIYAMTNGDVRRLLAPVDSNGRKCGIDDEVVNEPYLHFFDLSKCLNVRHKCETPQVCVKKCPSSNWADTMIDLTSLNYTKEHMICQTGIDVWNRSSKTEMHQLIESGLCAKWYLNSASIIQRCFPNNIPREFINITGLTDDKLEEVRRIVSAVDYAEAIVNTIVETKEAVIGLVICGAAVCLIFIFLLRWLAFPFVAISIVVVCTSLSVLAYYFYKLWVAEYRDKWMILTIFFAIIAGLVFIVAVCLINKIRLACQLIEEASEAVSSILSSLVFPVAPCLFHIATIVYTVAVGLHLYTLENEDYRWNYAFVAIHIFGFIWFYCFITALGEMILSSTFATWYWTFRKSDVPFFTLATSAWRTIRYHLGTVAFGALLITICRAVRWALEVLRISAGHNTPNDNGFVFCISCCAELIFRLLERFFKFMNRNAYIVCAVYGKGLCSSAADALSLLMRNVLRVVVLNNIVSWSLFVGKVAITALMGALTWSIFTKTKYETEYWGVPVIMVVVGAFLIGNVFFNVYEMAVDTIFLCFLEDCERHDGSAAKPYYMSYKLRKLLHKG